MNHMIRFTIAFVTFAVFLSGVANAQWVYLGRKALGKVRQITSEMENKQQPGYDVATVLLEAKADKVYSTTIAMLQSHQEWKITKRDDKAKTVEFSDGKRTAGMQITRLEDNLCQLLIVSAGTQGKSDTTSLVLNGVLRVCKEMGVQCEPADE